MDIRRGTLKSSERRQGLYYEVLVLVIDLRKKDPVPEIIVKIPRTAAELEQPTILSAKFSEDERVLYLQDGESGRRYTYDLTEKKLVSP